MKKRLQKIGLPLFLACSLLVVSSASVIAGPVDGMAGAGSSGVETEALEYAGYLADPDEMQTVSEETEENYSEEHFQEGLTETEDGNPEEELPETEENPEAKDEEATDGAEDPGQDSDGKAVTDPSEDPTATPYKELLADEDLIIVTISNSEPVSGVIEEERVEELSENEILALEEYVEEQGYAVTKAAMLAAAPKTTVRTITFNMNGFLSLAAEGFGSGYDAMFYIKQGDFQGNANGYCINPSVQAPGHNDQGREISYTASVTEYSDPMLLKIMYYGFGGPEDISGRFASTNPARHILTHMAATRRAAELGIPGAGNYTYRANNTAISLANQLYSAIQAKDDITGTVSIFTPVPGQQTIMLLSSYAVPPKETPKTSITVKKTVSGTAGNKNTVFHFKLTVYAADGKVASVKDFTLQHGQEKTFTDLPQGVKYKVEETDGADLGYTVTSKNASGTLGKDPVRVTFENRKEMIVPTGVATNAMEMGGMAFGILLAGMLFLLRRSKN